MNDQQNFTPLSPAQQEVAGKIVRDDKGRFIPGFSGNPAGGKKGLTLTEILRKQLEKIPEGKDKPYFEYLGEMVMSMIFKEKRTDILKLLWNYLDGLPKQKLQHEGIDGQSINFTINAGRGFLPPNVQSGAASNGGVILSPPEIQGAGVAQEGKKNNDGNNGAGQAGTA